MIEVLFQVRKDKFKDHPALIPELDLIEEDDQLVHLVTLEDSLDSQNMLSTLSLVFVSMDSRSFLLTATFYCLDVFKIDPDYLETEKKYKTLCKEILGSDDEGSDGDVEDNSDSDDDDSDNEDESKKSGMA